MLKKMSHVHDYFLGSTAGKFNKQAKEYIREKVTNTVGKETYQAYGASISIQALGGAGSTDFKECGDLYLNRLYELQNQLKEMIKEREAYIKTNLPAESKTLGVRGLKEEYKTLPVIREEEMWEPTVANIIPPIKYSREGIVVRFAKKKK
jgi:delta 1-pyrroline-5-carboxylate dehydrogenase